LALLLFYIHKDLKAEYVMLENTRELWVALRERYDQQKELIWPEANHEWNHRCLQDFKTVDDYNHAIHRIYSHLKFCEREPTDADKIEKTLSICTLLIELLSNNIGSWIYSLFQAYP
jgi:hypothetical protein